MATRASFTYLYRGIQHWGNGT